ncbi:hypothetical protein LguiA_034891 [Lonicera macranthoides]
MESSADRCKRGVGFESFEANNGGAQSVTSSVSEYRESSTGSSRSSSDTFSDEAKAKECSSPAPLGWPIRKAQMLKSSISDVSGGERKTHLDESKLKKLGSKDSATAFGQLWRLEPLPSEKKSIWRREMDWLLCVSEHVVELIPSWQTFPDGTKLEEILDGFISTEFWYVDQGIIAPEADGTTSFRKPIQRQEEKWWLPVPRVPSGGLSEDMRKQLNHKRECANQILKAAMAINSNTLAEMEVPESYWETLPKNGRASLGDVIYRYITSEQFSSECLLDCLDLSSEHIALEIANRVEAAIYVWRRRLHSKPVMNPNRSSAKSSWEIVKDLMVDGDKRELLAERAESLLICLKQRFPGLTQTTLDTSKIQCNKDVGKSILESYSRVLESLAFNIVARIDDLLYVDDLTRHSDKLSSVPTVSVIAHKRVSIPYSVPASGTPYKSAFSTPKFSPAQLISPARGERTPFLNVNGNKPPRRGFGVKKALTNYLGGEAKVKNSGKLIEGSESKRNADMAASRATSEVPARQNESSVQQNGSRLRPIDR